MVPPAASPKICSKNSPRADNASVVFENIALNNSSRNFTAVIAKSSINENSAVKNLSIFASRVFRASRRES
mgnify:CR=1 FL=1